MEYRGKTPRLREKWTKIIAEQCQLIEFFWDSVDPNIKKVLRFYETWPHEINVTEPAPLEELRTRWIELVLTPGDGNRYTEDRGFWKDWRAMKIRMIEQWPKHVINPPFDMAESSIDGKWKRFNSRELVMLLPLLHPFSDIITRRHELIEKLKEVGKTEAADWWQFMPNDGLEQILCQKK